MAYDWQHKWGTLRQIFPSYSINIILLADFSQLRISQLFPPPPPQKWPYLHESCAHGIIHLIKKNWWQDSPPHLPQGLCPWAPHALGLKTLASLVSVNGIFCNNRFHIFRRQSQVTVKHCKIQTRPYLKN